MQDEIIIHKNQTEMLEFMEDINDTKIFKCKKCCWYSHNEICLNPVSEYSNKNVKYNKAAKIIITMMSRKAIIQMMKLKRYYFKGLV